MLQVGDEIFDRFEPDREPQQVGRAGASRAFDAGAMFDEAFSRALRGNDPDFVGFDGKKWRA